MAIISSGFEIVARFPNLQRLSIIGGGKVQLDFLPRPQGISFLQLGC